MTNYILEVNKGQNNTAGTKAKTDIVNILKNNNFKTLNYEVHDSYIKRALFTTHNWKNTLSKVKNDDLVILQYPMYSRLASETFFKVVSKKQLNIKKVGIIHDLETLRGGKNNSEIIRRELTLLNQFDYLIVHNDSMKQALLDKGITTRMDCLEIFDYLQDNELVDAEQNKNIIFAGNLGKSTFLEKLDISKSVTVFGINPSESYPTNIEYQGVKSPDELPKYLDGSFGLVWDGSSLTTNDGIYGEYTRYNNPHKISLYLSSGLPVIVWKKAAIADFVIKNNLGITLDSLENIDNVLSNISSEEYSIMKQNVITESKKIREGFYIKNVLKRIVNS